MTKSEQKGGEGWRIFWQIILVVLGILCLAGGILFVLAVVTPPWLELGVNVLMSGFASALIGLALLIFRCVGQLRAERGKRTPGYVKVAIIHLLKLSFYLLMGMGFLTFGFITVSIEWEEFAGTQSLVSLVIAAGFFVFAFIVGMLFRSEYTGRPLPGVPTTPLGVPRAAHRRYMAHWPLPAVAFVSGALEGGPLELRPVNNRGAAALFVFGIFLFLTSLGIFLVVIVMGGKGMPLPLLLGGVAFMLIFMGAEVKMILTGLRVMHEQKLLTGTRVTTERHPLHPGQALNVHVCPSGAVESAQVSARLILREEAQHLNGSSTVTKDATLQELLPEYTVADKQVGLTRQVELAFRLPADAPPSFQTKNNRVEWLVELQLKLPNGKEMESRWPVLVIEPELLEPLREFTADMR